MRSLSSREVEGNGPTKPGNPLVAKTRRVPIPAEYAIPQDEGNEQQSQTPNFRGFFVLFNPPNLPIAVIAKGRSIINPAYLYTALATARRCI